MDGTALTFPEASFDVVYVHGVLPYAAEPEALVFESRCVLRPGGEAIFMTYNRISWLSLMTKLTGVKLEHADAPVFRLRSSREFRRLLEPFDDVRIRGERFPVASRLHGDWKGVLFNRLFVPLFRVLPRRLVRPFGWHLMAFCR